MAMNGKQRNAMLDVLGHDGVGTRLLNALGRNGIHTPEQLKEVPDKTISEFRAVGPTCMDRLVLVRRRLNPEAEKRTPDESLDRVAHFFESLANAFKKNKGAFMGDQFNDGERRLIISDLRRQGEYYRRSAEERREDAARHPEEPTRE